MKALFSSSTDLSRLILIRDVISPLFIVKPRTLPVWTSRFSNVEKYKASKTITIRLIAKANTIRILVPKRFPPLFLSFCIFSSIFRSTFPVSDCAFLHPRSYHSEKKV